MNTEMAFTMDTSSIKYGPGVTKEIGYDMKHLGVSRVMVLTDPNLSDSEPVNTVMGALHAEDLDAAISAVGGLNLRWLASGWSDVICHAPR